MLAVIKFVQLQFVPFLCNTECEFRILLFYNLIDILVIFFFIVYDCEPIKLENVFFNKQLLGILRNNLILHIRMQWYLFSFIEPIQNKLYVYLPQLSCRLQIVTCLMSYKACRSILSHGWNSSWVCAVTRPEGQLMTLSTALEAF